MSGSNKIFKTIGASNHTIQEREINDFYATDPIAIDKLANVFGLPMFIWEPACGNGLLSRRLKELGCEVYSTDIVDRGYGDSIKSFFEYDEIPMVGCDCILTNPPYSFAMEFVLHALDLLPDGGWCIMFLKTTFLEGKKRYEELFKDNPPKFILQFSSRVLCAKNAEFDKMRSGGGSAVAYAWFIWQKGNRNAPIIKWI